MPAVMAQRPTPIVTPDDPGWDEARKAWNLAVGQRPAAVAMPETAQDVAAAVRFARERSWRVAAQATGGHLHMDPENPVPANGDGLLLDSLPARAIDEVLDVAGQPPGLRSATCTG